MFFIIYLIYLYSSNFIIFSDALEPKFYKLLIENLNLENKELLLSHQYDWSKWKETKLLFQKIFKSKTQDKWTEIFHNTDSCVTPVLELTDSPLPTLNLISTGNNSSTSKGNSSSSDSNIFLMSGKHTLEILHEIGYDKIIKEFQNKKVINCVILDNNNSNNYIIKSYL